MAGVPAMIRALVLIVVCFKMAHSSSCAAGSWGLSGYTTCTTCPDGGTSSAGTEGSGVNGLLPLAFERYSASSVYADPSPPTFGLFSGVAWTPDPSDVVKWVQMDLITVLPVSGVITQGGWWSSQQCSVTTIRVDWSVDGVTWTTNVASGTANNALDADSMAFTQFTVVYARYVRIYPLDCSGGRCYMRCSVLSPMSACTCPTTTFRGSLSLSIDGVLHECSSCSTCASGLQYSMTACTSTSDTVCSICSQCTSGISYEVSACSALADTGCSQCTTCAGGYYTSSACTIASNAVCIRCLAGQYSSAGATSCQNCAAGTYSTPGASACTACPANFWSVPGAACTANAGYYDVGASMMAYYSFNPSDMLADGSGITGALTNIGAVTSVADTATAPLTGWLSGSQNVAYMSQPGSLANTDPLRQYFTMPAITFRSTFSICLWHRPTNTGSGSSIIGFARDSYYDRMSICRLNADAYVDTDNLGGSYMLNGWIEDSWIHLCMTVNSTRVQNYVNGVASLYYPRSSPFPGITYASGAGVIGRSIAGQQLYRGYVDEIRIFNTSLTAAGVKAVYNFRGDTNMPYVGASCSTCAADKYASTVCSSITDNLCTSCSTCTTGTYTSTSCTTYSNTVCNACSSCLAGSTYQSGACTTLVDTVCTSCATCAAGSTYQSSACTTSANTVCTACATCSAGNYASTVCTPTVNAACSACTSCVAGTSYESVSCTSASNRVCSACSACVAGATYQSGACTTLVDAVCTSCTACTAGSTYQSSACTTSANTVCTTCTTCSAGSYASTACTPTANTGCSACTSCVAGTSYQSVACTSASNRVCSVCTMCPAGYFTSAACTTTSNTVCTACPANFWSVSGAACTANTGYYDVGSRMIAYYSFNPSDILADGTGITGGLTNIGSVVHEVDSSSALLTSWSSGSQHVAYLSQPGGLSDGNSQMQYLAMPSITIPPVFSICAWYFPQGNPFWGAVYDIGNSITGHNIMLMRKAQTTDACTYLKESTGQTNGFAGWISDAWNHMCIVMSGSKFTPYVNGVMNPSTFIYSAYAGYVYAAGNGYIGRSHNSGIELFRGYIDEIRIFNKSLTLVEVQAVYNFRGDTTSSVLGLPCSSCSAGSYQSADCSATYDVVCSVCVICTAGTYPSTPCSTYSDAVCSTCSACVAGSTYSSSFCNSSSNTVCSACTVCPAGTYFAAACTISSNTACIPCPANSWSLPGAMNCTINSGYYNLGASLLAYYSFNPSNILSDISHVTGDLTNIGNVTWSAGSPSNPMTGWYGGTQNVANISQPGGVADVNTNRQYMTMPGITLSSTFSVCLWIYLTGNPTSCSIFDIASAYHVNQWMLTRAGTTSMGYFQYANNGSPGGSGVVNAWPDSTWSHMCMTLDTLRYVNVYLNGVYNTRFGPMTTFNGVYYPPGSGYIGRSWESRNLFQGYVDEIRVYNKSISSLEVQAIYAFRGDTTNVLMPMGCVNCTVGKFASTICSTGSDNVCVTCSTCVIGSTYKSSSCTSVADSVCSACAVCSIGSYRSTSCTATVNTVCITCPAGSYCSNVTSVLPCPAGKFCLPGVTAPTPCTTCANGQYVSGQCIATLDTVCSTCTNLPNNASYTGVGTNTTSCPFVCDPGYHGLACTSCPANSWCSAGINNQCPTNSQSDILSTHQNQCLCMSGYFGNGSVGGTSPCPVCTAGFFCAGGNSNLSVSCPVNFTSSIGASSVSDCFCKPGYELAEGLCQLCPVNGYCASGVLNMCPVNSFSPSGSSALSACTCYPGFNGPNGGPCVQCDANSFCVGGNSITACTPHAVSPAQSTNSTACYCDRGYEGVENAACAACPVNSWCWTGVRNSCPLNSSSLLLSSWWHDCTCNAGFTGPDGGPCIPCAAGTFKDASGVGNCTTCPEGSFCQLGSAIPTPCGVGNVCPAGASSAFTCPTGSFCPDSLTQTTCSIGAYCPLGSTSEVQCASGHFCSTPMSQTVCTPGYYCAVGSTQPIICPEGSMCAEGASVPIACAAGGFCPSGVSAVVPCPASTFSNATSQLTVDTCGPCSSCATGTNQSGVCTVTHDTQCSVCTNKPQHASYYEACQFQCDEDYYTSSCAPHDGVSQNALKSCGVNGQSYCGYSVLAGSERDSQFVVGGLWRYEQCNGLISALSVGITFQIDLEQIYDSINIAYIPGQMDSCSTYLTERSRDMQIYLGTTTENGVLCYNAGNTVGLFSRYYAVNDCKNIPARYITVVGPGFPGAHFALSRFNVTATPLIQGGVCAANCSMCSSCVAGSTYLTNACNRSANTVCSVCSTCLLGSYASSACNAAANTVCTACGSGSFCPANSIDELPCAAGHYCGTSSTQTPCTSGHFCQEGSVIQTLCAVGFVCTTPYAQVACDLGFYCPVGSSVQTPCAAGFYCQTPSNQTACSVGSYCPLQSTSQADCAAGHFCTTPLTQEVCSLGETCPTGSIAPAVCRAGYVCSTPTSQLPCSVGSFCPVNTTLELSCAAGSFCPTTALQTECALSSYCPSGSTQQTPCPLGYFCSTPATILPCELAGTYCPTGSTAQSPCAIGFVCSSAASEIPCSNGSYCAPMTSLEADCPAGFYCGSPASKSVCPATKFCPVRSSVPITCIAGSMCAAGVSAPTVCAAGGFCPFGVSAAMPCPASTFSVRANQSNVATCNACRACTAGSYQTDLCISTHDTQCAACMNKPANASYYDACQFRCNSGFFGSGCVACPANSWCTSETQIRCPVNSVSQPLSSSADSCKCLSGYSNTGSIFGLIQCVACVSGTACATGQSAGMVVHITPIPNITQVLLVQKTLPAAISTPSLFASVPGLWSQMVALVGNSSVFTRQICRGLFCVACDGSPTCVPRKSIDVHVVNGVYITSVARLQFDTLYQLNVASGVCTPSFIGLDPEFYTGTQIAVTSNSGVSTVMLQCLADPSLQRMLVISSTLVARRSHRHLLESDDSLAVSIVVPAQLVEPTVVVIDQANFTIQGYTTVNPPTITCQPGDYFPVGVFTPQPCLAGSYCPGDGSIYSCQPGTRV